MIKIQKNYLEVENNQKEEKEGTNRYDKNSSDEGSLSSAKFVGAIVIKEIYC